MQKNIIKCVDGDLYEIDQDLMASIKAQGDLTNNVLLDLAINNPKVFCNNGLNHLRPVDYSGDEDANYDPYLNILTYDCVDYDLSISESDLEYDSINACYEYTAELENGDYIYLSWDIDVDISENEIKNPPLDFNNPWVTEYCRSL
jgi:hypothetical protein